jgi:2-(1,2-epoxy-1,2-dihydrophenyl)acetyl-CoA isomerase
MGSACPTKFTECVVSSDAKGAQGGMSFDEGMHVGRTEGIAIVTMSNPERRNAFYPEMRRKLTAILLDLGGEADVRAIVLTGHEGHFCAGADVSRMRRGDTRTPGALQVRETMKEVSQLLRLIAAGSKPVIAAVEGDAFGAGLSIAAASDVVVASRDARFGAPFTKIGILPDMGLLFTLPRRVGLSRAKQMMMLAEPMGGEEAARIGLVDRLCEPRDALRAAIEFGGRFTAVAPVPVALIKAALADGVTSIEDAIRIERDLQPLLSSTSDAQEGITAFKEKRKPGFLGR